MRINKHTIYLIFQNIIVLFFLLVLMELFSFFVLYVHKAKVSTKIEKVEQNYDGYINNNTKILNPKYSSQELKKKFSEARAKEDKLYSYSSHLVYKNKLFSSEYLNIDERGVRLNGKKNNKDDIIKEDINNEINIWFSGGSNIFGVTNADHQTVPAYLEMFLSEYNKKVKFNVLNLGVVGYSSIQELLNIRFNMLSNFNKPDILIVMNGINDYHNAFLSRENKFEGLLKTGLGTDKVLNYYWQFHNDKKLINTQNILIIFREVFSNTITLSEKARKYFILKEANKDINKFIKEYLEKKQATFELVNNNLEKNNKFYLGNMKLIADFAKSQDIKVLFILQPMLYEAEKIKNLVEQEITEYIHTRTGYFALEDKRIKELTKVSSELVLAKYYWDFNQYIQNYQELRKELKKLCNDLNIDYLNMNSSIERNKNKSIFSSPYHYTYIGAEIFGNEISNRLINNRYFELGN